VPRWGPAPVGHVGLRGQHTAHERNRHDYPKPETSP